tara:strand:- start:292 stop:486 length:195 start_codon:yes stop_codon:yes gene_type:complete
MINTVTKTYLTDEDGTNLGFANQYKVVYQNGITSFVPHDPDNADYQAIQEWAKIEGNNIIDPGA